MATDKRASTQSGPGNLRFKRLRKHKEIAVDRISELPDSLLLLILSFLPALYVARTCILSRRWQNLWTTVPRLDFGYDISFEELWYRASFVKFVNRFLLKYKGSSIHTFKLTSYLADSCDAELWMRWAINRNVKVLDLQFPRLPLYLPQSASGSKSLMDLKLCGQQLNMTAPPSSRFPCLKTLKLYSSKVSDGEFENALIACCDVLENLSIQRAEMKSLRVDARQLKHLKLDLSELSESKGTGCLIEINAPALEDLIIRVYGSCSLLIKNVGTLSKAEICLSNSKAFRSLIKCFSALESVKSLSLSSSYSRKACILKPGPMVRNVNLTHLTIGAKSVWAQLLPYFFDCFPNLEVLILKKEPPVGHHVAGDLCIDPILLPANLAPRLRVFEAGEFTETLLGMLKCLLMNCSVLETVRIHYLYTSQTRFYSTCRGTEAREIEEKLLECEEKRCELEQKLRVTQKILSFPRASHKCEIKFI